MNSHVWCHPFVRSGVCMVLLFGAVVAHGAELTGGVYAIQVSLCSAGGGMSSQSTANYVVWDSVQAAGPGHVALGDVDLFGGVYTPVIPEPASALAACILVVVLRRKRP